MDLDGCVALEDQGCINEEEKGSPGISGKEEDNLRRGEELGLGGTTSTSNLLGE